MIISEFLIIYALKTFIIKEMLLITPILAGYEFIQLINLFGCRSYKTFVIVHFARMAIILLFRVLLDPIVHNIQIYKKRIYRWLMKKAEQDDFYERFVNYFSNETHQ